MFIYQWFGTSQSNLENRNFVQPENVVIVGITRDDFYGFNINKAQIEELGSRFQDYRVVLAENDSTESYRDILIKWASENSHVKIISKTLNLKKRPSLGTLARMRNEYVHELRKPEYDTFNKIIVLDIDMTHRWPIESIAKGTVDNDIAARCVHIFHHTFYHDSGYGHRDILALRSKEHFPNYLKDSDDHVVTETQAKVLVKSDKWFRDQRIVTVDSCFGGMTIYSKPVFDQCLYNTTSEDCEHISLNECIRVQMKKQIVLDTTIAFPFHLRKVAEGALRRALFKLPYLVAVLVIGTAIVHRYLIRKETDIMPTSRKSPSNDIFFLSLRSGIISVVLFSLLEKRSGENSFHPCPECLTSSYINLFCYAGIAIAIGTWVVLRKQVSHEN